jgi:hypothetical protein
MRLGHETVAMRKTILLTDTHRFILAFFVHQNEMDMQPA